MYDECDVVFIILKHMLFSCTQMDIRKHFKEHELSNLGTELMSINEGILYRYNRDSSTKVSMGMGHYIYGMISHTINTS